MIGRAPQVIYVFTKLWSSIVVIKKQLVVSLSSTEVEFIAAALCACQAVWLKG